ncbi:MAG: MBL fold metallo-hydrolase [Candidatus Dormibacteria bacterium]
MPTPYQIAKDTFVIPHVFPAPPFGNITANSLVIRGKEPVIVDTGPPGVRSSWLEQAWSLVDPADVRWIFLSHDDGDHVGNLDQVLAACPNARLVTGWFMTGRMTVDQARELPMPRCYWLNDGDSLDVGDRTLHAIRPPIFDAPTTRGLFDATTGVYWASDAFAQFIPEPVNTVDDITLDADQWDRFYTANGVIAPWHQWLDDAKYQAHVDTVEKLGIDVIASAHTPTWTGSAVNEAVRRIREMASRPAFREPGQPVLEHMLAEMMRPDAIPAQPESVPETVSVG